MMKKLSILMTMLFVQAICAASTGPIKAHKRVVAKTISIAEKNICNPAFLKSEEWKTFVAYVYSEEVLALDDYAFVKAFNKASDALPFSHFYIKATPKFRRKLQRKARARGKKISKRVTQPFFELTEINEQTALLSVRAFVQDAALMKRLTQEVLEKGYKNLIIDMRNNSGGTLDAPVILGQFLTNNMIDAGSYLNRSWFDKHEGYPSKVEIDAFPYLTEMTYKGFQKAAQNPAFRMVLPPHSNPTFQGEVYILTNGRTASACEPLVHLLKNSGLATIVGERTAGEMLSGATFPLNKKMSLFLPVQDYITADGNRLDRVGVIPDIEVPSEKAMEAVLDLLK